MASCHRGPLGHARPLSIAAVDAAISETIGRPVRRDRLARDDRVYRWIVRRAIAEGSLRFKTTYAEAAAGSSYSVPRLNCRANRRRARECRVSTMYRALTSLQGAGLVVFRGVKRANGQWRCLEIELLRYDGAPAGRSRRRPTRCPGGRVLFSAKSGTSPAVVLPDKLPKRRVLSARARGEPEKQRGRDRETFRALIFESLAEADRDRGHDSRRRWPNEPFDLTCEPLVILTEEFERAFGCEARFSFKRNSAHGKRLRGILHRLDRYRCGGPSGLWLLQRCIQVAGGTYPPGYVHSLAYFLPMFAELAKMRRRQYRRHWGEVEASLEGIPSWL